MEEIVYLDVAEVIGIHVQFMERTGARSQGIRSQNELESALARPQMAAYYERADLIRQATLIAVGISQNQPFVDGNKRTAFAAADAFLRLNGFRTTGNGIEFAKHLEAVAERDDSLDAATDRFEVWLRSTTVPTKR
jgi:death-on-curing protein